MSEHNLSRNVHVFEFLEPYVGLLVVEKSVLALRADGLRAFAGKPFYLEGPLKVVPCFLANVSRVDPRNVPVQRLSNTGFVEL